MSIEITIKQKLFGNKTMPLEIILGNEKETYMPFLDNLLISCLKVENSPMLNEALNLAQQQFFAGETDDAAITMNKYIAALEKCCEMLRTSDNPLVSELYPWAEKQFIALDLVKNSASHLFDNSQENKEKPTALLIDYLLHPKTLCDFSLQAFAERMLTL